MASSGSTTSPGVAAPPSAGAANGGAGGGATGGTVAMGGVAGGVLPVGGATGGVVDVGGVPGGGAGGLVAVVAKYLFSASANTSGSKSSGAAHAQTAPPHRPAINTTSRPPKRFILDNLLTKSL